MRNSIYVLILLQYLYYSSAIAQNFAVYNSYYVNPYLYNPAEAATEYTYVFVNHRQQWMNVEGAPVLTTLNVNTMFNESRAGVGMKASSFSRGLLTTTDLTLTYAYGVPLNKKSSMFFGLSGGAISNEIDISEIDPADPAIANYLANNIQPAANFGFLVRSATGFNFGMAVPQLFSSKFNNESAFQNTSVSPLDNVIVSAYFRRKIEGKIVNRYRRGVRKKVKTNESYAPLELYTLYKYSRFENNQFEVLGKLNLSQNFWLAAAYKQSYGFAGSLGFTVSRFILSYAYEPGNQPQPAFSQGTHELQLGLRLGEAKKYKRAVPLLRSTLKTANESHSLRFQHKEDDPDAINQLTTERKKYYVVIRSFSDFVSADNYKKKLVDQKYNGNVFYNAADKKFHVHVFETVKSSEAHEEVRNLKNYTKLNTARVLTVTITTTD